MDELDEFLAELESSAVISPTGPAHPNPDTNTSIEKELYDIFGDIASDTPVATGNFISNGVPMEKDESTAGTHLSAYTYLTTCHIGRLFVCSLTK